MVFFPPSLHWFFLFVPVFFTLLFSVSCLLVSTSPLSNNDSRDRSVFWLALLHLILINLLRILCNSVHIHTYAVQPSGCWFAVYDAPCTPPCKMVPGQHPHLKVTWGKHPAGWSSCGSLLRALIFCPSSPKSVAALPAWRGGWIPVWFSIVPLPIGTEAHWRPIIALVLKTYEAYFCRALRQLGEDRGLFSPL